MNECRNVEQHVAAVGGAKFIDFLKDDNPLWSSKAGSL